MNTKKTAKILSLVAVLALVLTTVVAFGITASAETTEVDTVEVTNAAQLSAAMTGAEVTLGDNSVVTLKDGGTIVVKNDIVDVSWGNTSSRASTKSFTLTSGEGGPFTIYRGEKDTTATHNRSFLSIAAGCTVKLENIVLDGMKDYITDASTSGGAFNVASGATLILNDGAVIQNFAAKIGGGVYSKGTFIINAGAVITGNSVSPSGNSRGGGIAVYGGKTFMMGGSINANINVGTYGAGVAVSGGIFYMYGGEISENNISASAATAVHGTAINLSTNGIAYLVGGEIKGNTHTGGNGRAIGLYSTSAKLYLGTPAGVTIPEGADAATGEALLMYQNSGLEAGYAGSATGAQIHVISALPAGSRVFLTDVPSLDYTPAAADELASAIFQQSSATAFGGPLFYENGALTFKNAYQVGDATYATLAAACTAAADNGTVTVLYDTFTYGTLPAGTYTINGNGNTLYRPVEGTRMFTPAANANITIVNLKLDGDGTTTSGNGGAFNLASGVSLTVGEGTVISNFTATNGGAISVSGTLNMTDGELSGNTATGNGGAIYVAANATANVSGGVISNNTSANGAGIACDGTLNLSGTAKVADNDATGYGGGVLIAGASSGGGSNGTLNMSGGIISGNTAGSPGYGGGGIYFTSRGRGSFTGGEISDNVAANNGGGIYFGGATTYEMSGVTVSGNDGNLGGGIYVTKNATLSIIDSNILNNTATNGGGIHFDENGNATVSGATVMSGNTASNGGGIFSEEGTTLTVTGGAEIKDNTATSTTSNQGGGAIYNKGTLTLASCTISGNIAYKAGAGIVNATGATAYIEDGALITLNLGYGSGVYGGGVRNIGTLIMSGGEVSYNATTAPTAGSDTRGAGVHSTGTLWMTGGSITENVTVGGYGGGVFIGGKFYMLGGEITDNRLAKQGSNAYGPGINLSTDTVDAYFLGGTISGNKYVNKVAPNEDCAVEGRPSIEVKDDGQMIITTYSGGKKYSITVYAGVYDEKPEIMIYANSKPTNVYVGGSIPVADAPVADGVNGVSNDGTAVTTTNALCIPTAPNGAPTFGYRSGNSSPAQLILNGNLNAGSQVVLPDNFSDTDNYFMTVAEGVVLDKTTLGAIQLNGADAAYNAEIIDGKLVWPADKYQVWQNAGLQDNIAYRLYWAYRSASNKTLPTVTFDGETVELGTVSSSLAALIKEPYYEGLTYVEVRLAPKQISETISVVLGEENKTYTLADYLNLIKEAGGTLGALVNATLNYGTAAQAYFGETEDRANANYQAEIADISAASGTVLNQFADKALPLFKSASVVLGDKVSVKIIIKQWVENFQYSVTLGGETYTPTTVYDAENGLYMIVVENISACDLADRIVVTMTDGENTATLDYSVLEYAINKKGVAEGGLDYVAKALYAYANAAAAYVAAN